jgi:hypothetical protein
LSRGPAPFSMFEIMVTFALDTFHRASFTVGRIRLSESTSYSELTISCFFFPNVSVIVVPEGEGKS